MLLLLSSMCLVQSCAKDGLDGKDGTNGTNGQNGISGAIAYEFVNQPGSFTQNINIDSNFINSSATMVYYRDASLNGSIWYAAPGLGANGTYNTRYFITINNANSAKVDFIIYNPNGSPYSGASVLFSKVKVVFIPHTLAGKKDAVDYSDYNAVAKYYGFKD